MKRILTVVALIIGLVAGMSAGELADKLKKMKRVKSVTELKSKHYGEKLEVMFEQPLDPKDPKSGKFEQRLFMMHRGFDRPTVMVTNGYGASGASRETYQDEIAELLDANLIFVEHRYFEKSQPKPCDWKYLTIENSAYDYHAIRTEMGAIYGGKWVSTGISKGGSTTIYYCVFFPGDVDAYVPYVGPINTGVQDGRHEHFLNNNGTPLERKALQDFQLEVLKRKDRLMPGFEAFCNEQKLKFKRPIREIFDYCVLEFPFAFWQWGYDVHKIPDLNGEDKPLLDFLTTNAGPDYFSALDRANFPFYMQVVKDYGYYGYDIVPFTKYLDVKSTKNYMDDVFLPDEYGGQKYDGTTNSKTFNFLIENDPKMIFVYGECDPWSATGIGQWLDFSKKSNMKLYVDPHGSHRARIKTLPPTQQNEAIRVLKGWLGME